jgi:hypothetical protein
MKPLSTKRQVIERQMLKAYADIQIERGAFCEESDATNFEHSHNYPRNPFIWLIPVAENITLLSREKHLDFEGNELWKLPNIGPKIMRQMMALMLAETDVDRRKLMRSHYVRKLYAMKEQAEAQDVELPGWCKTLLNEIGI